MSKIKLPSDLTFQQKERIKHLHELHWSGGGNGVTSMQEAEDKDVRKYLRQQGYREVGKTEWQRAENDDDE